MASLKPAVLAALVLLAGCADDGRRPEKHGKALAEQPHCIRETGTRIPDSECQASPGRSISREELERTGEPSTGDAIGKVVPR